MGRIQGLKQHRRRTRRFLLSILTGTLAVMGLFYTTSNDIQNAAELLHHRSLITLPRQVLGPSVMNAETPSSLREFPSSLCF